MALIVQKYGGTSVADPDRMRAVAENVSITKRRGNDVVVVVSAMGKATDNLIALASQVSSTRPGREMDMLLTTGERVSAALLTMALADLVLARIDGADELRCRCGDAPAEPTEPVEPTGPAETR